VGQISGSVVEALLRPNLRNTFDGHPLRCIDKKEKKKVHG